jgi:hypothetical protein
MDTEALSLLTRTLINKQIELEQAAAKATSYRQHVVTGKPISLDSLGLVRQYKDAELRAEELDSEVKKLIEEVVASYDSDMIWFARKTGTPLFLLRPFNSQGYYQLMPPVNGSLEKNFTIAFHLEQQY